MLAIQKHIIEHGLDATIEKFKLDFKDYPHKILLKYKQIDSPMSEPEVQDARGLVLKKSDWSVMSLAFRKFFNIGEGKGDELDWSSATVFEKMDGTLIHVYYDSVIGKVCFGTTGTAEGEGNVDNFHWSPDGSTTQMKGTFADLFWKSFLETSEAYYKENPKQTYDLESRRLVPWYNPCNYKDKEDAFYWLSGYTLAFELCTPYNIVVTPHSECRVYLLGVRKLHTMQELPLDEVEQIARSIGVYTPHTFDLKSAEDVQRFVSQQPFKMEGAVACDARFVRRKLKNPAYIAVHYMREATAYWRIVDVVRSGECEEYLAYFPGRAEEVHDIERKWILLHERMNLAISEIKPYSDRVKSNPPESTESRLARKDAALAVAQVSKQLNIEPFRSHLFNMLGNTRTPAEGDFQRVDHTLDDFLRMYDGREMYEILNKWEKQ